MGSLTDEDHAGERTGADALPRDEVDDLITAWRSQRPDLDVEPLQVLSRVSRLARHLDIARRGAFAAHALESWEFDVLSALRRAGPPFQLTPGALLRATLVTSGTMTNRIDRLTDSGLVFREPDPRDRRGVLVTLSERGRDVVDAAFTDLLDREQALLARLGPAERQALSALLRTLLIPFDEGGTSAAKLPGPVRRGLVGKWPSLEGDMAHLLGAEALHLEYPTKVVFDSVTLGLNEGDRVGIVGRNGEGKSSLLAMLAGRQQPDSGRVTVRGGVRVGVLGQADTLDDALTVAAAVVGDTPEHVWAGDARARDVIRGLLADVPWDAPVSTLSGGQRRRVELAALLAGDWDVLVLDEPTNHLDVEAITWLADHLKRRWAPSAGGLLVVTHDRWFLDEVCTATWEVHDRIVESFEGGYAAYILQRVERDRMAASSEAKRQNLARKELAWLRRGAPARTSKPKFRIDAANALIADVPEIRDNVSLRSLAVARLGKDVVDLLDVSVAYDDNQVLRGVEWRIAPAERTGILGVNGAGKSTLLGLIAGTVRPSEGTVKRGKTVKIATLAQRLGELEDHLNEPVRMILDQLRTSYTIGIGSKAQDLTPTQLLERLGFSSAQLSTPVKDLSGGQQRRLQLLLIMLDQPNVLILDEPTNDLDTDMLAVIEDLLDSWPGTLIVVSHDRYFLERVTDQQYAILDGHLRHLPGGVEEYLRLRATAVNTRSTATARSAVTTGNTGATGRSTAGSNGAPAAAAEPALSGAALRDTQKEIASIERRLAKLADEINTAKNALATHDHADYQGLTNRMKEISQLESDVQSLEERWFELTELIG